MGRNIFDFFKKFPDDDACKYYLAEYKWKDGFVCPKCGCKQEYYCSYPHYKRCKECLHLESVIAGTGFEKIKFGMQKAFFILFIMSTTSKGSSSLNISTFVGINKNSAWLFEQKVRIAMQSSQNYPLTGKVCVDECFIGGYEEGKIGRGAEKKAQVVIAIETVGNRGIKRGYALRIDNANADELKTIFEKHISKEAKIMTDKWTGYKPLQDLYNIQQIKSEPGKNFELIHRFIQNLKSWIRGIYHHTTNEYLQVYLDEYCYRFNRSNHKETIFDNLIQRVMNEPHNDYKSLKKITLK